MSAFVATDADDLIVTRLSVDAELPFLEDLAGACTVETLDPADLRAAGQVARRYPDLELGSPTHRSSRSPTGSDTRAIGTLDEGDLRAIEPLAGGGFELWPADQPHAS